MQCGHKETNTHQRLGFDPVPPQDERLTRRWAVPPSNAVGRNLIGTFIPQCDNQGQYTPQQCWGSTECKERPQTPCEIARDAVDPNLIGTFIPQCVNQGQYTPQQCWGSTGQIKSNQMFFVA
ncbi:unnamed protein product [Coregonus sp. 'balchen']|nr:unnamed protein product [Coregonus sp. 'balchen']